MAVKILIMLSTFTLIAGEVIFVVDAVRHGIHTGRTNLSQIPDITWPIYDELTAGGIRQQYLLGRLRRKQYIEIQQFLNENFDPKAIEAKVSNFRRNLMSAQSYLLGLYPYGVENLNENQRKVESNLLLPKIPLKVSKDLIDLLKEKPVPGNIPVFPLTVLDRSVENILRIYNCPLFEYTIGGYFESNDYSTLFKKYNPLWEMLRSAYPFLTTDYLMNSDNAAQVTDFFLSAEGMGIRPSKFTEETINLLKNFWGEILEAQMMYNPILVTISIYEWTKEIIEYMDRKINGKEDLKYVLYSSHSRGVFSLLAGVKKFNNTIKFETDDFSSNILFELTKENSTLFVAVYYNGELIHKEKYEDFKKKFLDAGELGMSREEACRAPKGFIQGTVTEYWD